MNQAGNLLLFIFIGFLIIALVPPIIMMVFPIADIIMRIILALVIFLTVRGYLGSNTLSLVISGILVYILVIKWGYFTASMYVFFYFLMAFSFLSVMVWGIGVSLRPK